MNQLIPMPSTLDPMPDTHNDLDASRRRALYRAEHRGTKEMDWLLGRFARAKLTRMDDADLEAFEEFLALPDPDIQRWLMTGDADPPEGMAGNFVARLKRFHDL
jgi:antitoxin CptB